MPWVRFDDQFPIHRKVKGLSDSAFRLHAEAIFWCARNLTDGYVTAEDVLDLATARRPLKSVPELVARGNWHEADQVCHSKHCPAHVDNRPIPVDEPGDSGWLIHDYFDYQPSKEKVLRDREAKAKRQARWLEKQRRGRDASQDASIDVAPPRPEGSGGGGRPRASGATGRSGQSPAVRAVPDWCGQCDERTRQIEADDGRPMRCPTCHWLREEAS